MSIFDFAKSKVVKLAERITTKMGTEISTYKSPYFSDSMDFPYNPDELARKDNYSAYDQMGHDDQVKASFKTKKLMITSRNWIIEPASEDPKDVEIAEFVTYCFTNGYRGVFKNYLDEVLSALQYGFSITEKVYKLFDSGDYAGKIGIKSLKTRPPQSFEIDINDYGDIEYLLQYQMDQTRKLNPKKFIIYSYDSKFGNPYGESDFKAAYRSWFTKAQVIRYWAIYLERHGMPIVKGKYKQGINATERSNLLNIMKSIQAKTVFAFPESVDVELLEAKNGTVDYQTSIEAHNTMIARSFLLPELLGFSSHTTGSQALGREQFDMFYRILEDIQIELEDLNNEELIRDLVNLNFADVTHYPKFVFTPLENEEKTILYDTWLKAVQGGVVVSTHADENYLRQQLGFPEREESVDDDIEPQEPKEQTNPVIDDTIEEQKDLAEKIYSRKFTEYEDNANMDQILDDYNDLAIEFAVDVDKVTTDIQDSFMIQILRKDIIKNKNFVAVNKLSVSRDDAKAMTKAFLKNARKDFLTGDKTAKDSVKQNVKLIETDTTGALIPSEALAYISNKAIGVSGTELEYITKNVKSILTSGIKNGKSESTIVFELNNFFDTYSFSQKLPDGTLANINDIKGRLNTIVRTNLSDAYNQGRVTAFNNPKVSDFIVAYQYSAIIDQNTTDFCLKYDQRIYQKDNPIWDNLTPPNHFNCRSTLIPIFKIDEFETDRPLAIQQPEQFGGQPTS